VRNAVISVSAFTVMVIAACTPADDSRDLARADALRSELAGAAHSQTHAVVSDFEVPPTGALTDARRGTASDPDSRALGAPARQGTRAVTDVASGRKSEAAMQRDSGVTSQDVRVGSLVVRAPALAVTTSIANTSVEPEPIEVPSPRSNPMESTGENDGYAGPAAERPRPNPAIDDDFERPRPGIIVRGGPPSGRDPCAIHRPAGTGVMVNNRLPTRPGPTMGGVRPVRLPGIRG
jgi:hypothetical protein